MTNELVSFAAQGEVAATNATSAIARTMVVRTLKVTRLNIAVMHKMVTLKLLLNMQPMKTSARNCVAHRLHPAVSRNRIAQRPPHRVSQIGFVLHLIAVTRQRRKRHIDCAS